MADQQVVITAAKEFCIFIIRQPRLYFYGYEMKPRFTFYWDEAVIFEIKEGDFDQLSQLMYQWVYEKKMPSVLKQEFPGIDFGALAFYYENGNGLEGEFFLSWDQVENFFKGLDSNKAGILTFIQHLRQSGYDKRLRAGT